MQPECQLIRDAIAGNSVAIDSPPAVEVVVNGQHFPPGGVRRETSPVQLAELTRSGQSARAANFREAHFGQPNSGQANSGQANSGQERVAVITHELRNALGIIRNATHLLNASVATGSEIEEIRLRVLRQVGQMSRLIEDLLEGPRSRNEAAGLMLERFDLNALLRGVLRGIEPEIERRGQQLIVNMPDRPVYLRADAGRLEQVFANLLLNAAKYTGDGGEITLTLDTQAEVASVRIRDSGIGIAEHALPFVFGLFVQAAPLAPASRGGQGIGLAVVRHFVELHGGSVTAASAGLGLGSEFEVLLPGAAT